MFVKDGDFVEVVIYYKPVGKHYEVYSKLDFEKLELKEEELNKYKKVTIKMRELTWGLYNDFQEYASEYDAEGNRRFNYKRYKELRLVKLIVQWDATMTKNDRITHVPVNEQSIRCLAPEIAETILSAYDEVMYVSEDEEGK